MLELLAEPDHGSSLLVVRGSELRDVAFDARLDLLHGTLLSLGEADESVLDVALRSLEVVGNSLQPFIEAALDVGKRVRQSLSRPSLAFGKRRTSLFSEPPLLCRELRNGVGALERQRPANLLDVRRRLLGNRCSDPGACLGDEYRRCCGSPTGATQRQREAERESERPTEAGDEKPDDHAETL